MLDARLTYKYNLIMSTIQNLLFCVIINGHNNNISSEKNSFINSLGYHQVLMISLFWIARGYDAHTKMEFYHCMQRINKFSNVISIAIKEL